MPTLDAPEYGYTRETTDELYCPDILFREKDEYGNDVTKIGRPLPIEYLLTDVNTVVSPENETKMLLDGMQFCAGNGLSSYSAKTRLPI